MKSLAAHTLRTCTLLFACVLGFSALGQLASQSSVPAKWLSQQAFEHRVFIENVGQFTEEERALGSKIYFSCRTQSAQIFFTANGFAYKYFVKRYKKEKEEGPHEINSEEDKKEELKEELRESLTKPYYVESYWLKANKNAAFVAEGAGSIDHCYAVPGKKGSLHAKGFSRLVLKDLYPGIDVEFSMPEEGGFKYNLLVKAGADVGQVKLKHKGLKTILAKEDGLNYYLENDQLLEEKAPLTYYADSKEKINCSYVLSKKTESFSLSYDHSRDIVIDPWIVNPNFVGWNRAYDVARDNNGNILAYGGPVPYQLNKYSPTGALIWTFTTPYNSELYGDFAIDATGNIILTEGFSGGHVVKIDPNANVLYTAFPTNGGYAEFWRIAYNCDFTVLRVSGFIQGGGGALHQIINIDPNTGAMLGTSGAVSYESRSLFIDRNGFIYSLSPTQFAGQPNYVTRFDPALNMLYAQNSGYVISEGTGGYINSNYVGCGSCFANQNGVTADVTNVYTYDGATLYKRRNANGVGVDSMAVPNGVMMMNSGIILDACNNLYIGTQNSVLQLDTNFNILATVATPGPVYDLCFSQANNIVAAGDGFVSELNLSTSCNLVIATAGDSACVGTTTGSATVTVTPQPGDTPPYSYQWSNGATTAIATGLAPGTYYVVVKDNSCGTPKLKTDSVVIPPIPLPVIASNTATICAGQQTATLTATGAASYAWGPATGLSITTGSVVSANPGTTQVYTITGTSTSGCVNTATTTVAVLSVPVVTATSTTICPSSTATVTSSGASTYTWSTGGTGNTLTQSPAATTSYTVTGTDASGCTDTAIATISVLPSFSMSVNSGAICAGQQTITLSSSGAASYAWSPGTGLSSTTNGTVTANPGTTTVYTVVGTAGTCTAQATSTVTVNTPPVVAVNSGTICVGSSVALNGAGAPNYSWTPALGLSATTGATVSANPTTSMVYTVVGTDANNCTGIASATVAVNPLPVVNVNSTSICSGGSAVLTVGGASTYSWNPAGTLSAATGATVTAQPATTTSYTVTGTDANNCVNTAVSTVTVTPNPIVSANSGNICVGQQTLALNATGATTYTWSPATGLSSSSGANVNANPNATTTYTVLGAIGTCTAMNTSTVTVNPLPNVTATSTAICNGQSGTLTAAGATTYTWSNNTNGNTLSMAAAVTVTFTVTGTDNNGCYDTAQATITVNPLPTVTVNSPSVCAGSSTSLTAGGAASYAWSPATGLSATSGATVTATPAATGNYVVTGTDANTCVNTATAVITVMQRPVVAINSIAICAGSSGTLSASGANTYTWFPTSGLSSSNGASVTANPPSTMQYAVYGTDIFGCMDTGLVTVTVNPLPIVSLGPLIASGCAPLCVTFTNTSATSGACSWDFNDGTASNACSPVHCFSLVGTLTPTLTITDANNCSGNGTATVIVYPVPAADFNASPQPTTIFDAQIHFYDVSTNAVITGWEWTFGDPNNTNSQLPDPVFLYNEPGEYPVTLIVTSDFGCIDTVVKTITIDPETIIYVPNAFTPNFDGDNDVFMAKGEGIKDFKLYVFDRWGEQVFFSDDIYKGWDGFYRGQRAQIDVYVWKIELTTWTGEPRALKGTVSLLK